jgi:[protein-PII] uridylyltransferase
VLAQNGVDMYGARVATLGERAEDIFTVDGERLHGEKERLRLERELLAVL